MAGSPTPITRARRAKRSRARATSASCRVNVSGGMALLEMIGVAV
jgi:hypothetical protein